MTFRRSEKRIYDPLETLRNFRELPEVHSRPHVCFFSVEKIAGRLPMTPQEAVKYYGCRLTEFERAEIEKYSEIWYLGLSAHKIHGEEVSSQNGGYDDENGSYNKVLHDHISYR